jgi:hypothetical protein
MPTIGVLRKAFGLTGKKKVHGQKKLHNVHPSLFDFFIGYYYRRQIKEDRVGTAYSTQRRYRKLIHVEFENRKGKITFETKA